jgi:site-specific recombinase XerD
VAPNTIETYLASLNHLRRFFGTYLICDIDAAMIGRYQRSRTNAGAAAATINKEVVCLSSILSKFALWLPLRYDVRMLEEREVGMALSPGQEGLLLERASRVGNIGHNQGHWSPVYTVVQLALNTGMRHSEVRRLRWKDIDLSKRLLRVGHSKTEAGSGRYIPLNQPAWAALETWTAGFPNRLPEHFVFPACENGKIDVARPISNWRTAWGNLTCTIECMACGRAQPPAMKCRNEECQLDLRGVESPIAALRFHDLRHTATTKMLENGVPYATVALLGWSATTAVRMAKRYGHIRPEAQRRALEVIATTDWVPAVHQIGNQVRVLVESPSPKLLNSLP